MYGERQFNHVVILVAMMTVIAMNGLATATQVKMPPYCILRYSLI